MFKRKIYSELKAWKDTSDGRTALMIEGARRIGKSTVVEHFAQNEYRSYILIDFAFAPEEVQQLFDDVSDLDYLFLRLQLHFGVQLHERESLIIFDEVQFNPKARQAIKRLVADHRYDYIETGSLISIRKHVANILIPSEERHLQMWPMDFEEFLWAIGDETSIPLLSQMYHAKVPLGQGQNRIMLRKFRLYMLVGGMPQAVQAYVDHNNLQAVDDVKRDIINLYEADFYKIDESGKISALFDAIPSELSKHSVGYQVSSVLPNSRKSTLETEFAELIASRTVIPAHHVNDPNVGLAKHKVLDHFRLYMGDTGLLVTLMYHDRAFTDNILYERLLNDKLSDNLGILYENIVAQMLATQGHRLYYHTFYDPDQKRTFEVDFLIANESKIHPIEVKSSRYRAHKSLDRFASKYSARTKEKIVLSARDLQVGRDTLYLPIYMACFL